MSDRYIVEVGVALRSGLRSRKGQWLTEEVVVGTSDSESLSEVLDNASGIVADRYGRAAVAQTWIERHRLDSETPDVIVEIRGGTAEITHERSDLKVVIRDWDALEAGLCPDCRGNLVEEPGKPCYCADCQRNWEDA